MKFKQLFQAHDVTVGEPWKRILELAAPLLIGNIAQQLYNTVDTIVVGKYVGDNALSAVGAAGPILNIIFILFVGVATGAGILVSQRVGAKDREGLSQVIGNCMTLTLLASLLTTALGFLITLCHLFGGRNLLQVLNTPEGDIYTWCRQYLLVIFAGVTGSIFYNIFAGILRGMGDSVSTLLFLLLACGLNIVLDLWLVAGLGMGVFGVALATIIAQAVSAVACGLKLFRMHEQFHVGPGELKLDRRIAGRILGLGFPSGVSQGIFAMSSLLVQSLTNSMGPMVIACNVVVMRIDGFVIMPFFSISSAMTTYAGQNFGAQRLDRLEQGVKQTLVIALVTAVTLISTAMLLARPLASIFTDTPELVTLSVRMFRILGVGYLAFSVPQALAGFLNGIGHTRIPMWISIITQVVLRIPTAYLFAKLSATPEYPNGQAVGLFLSLTLCWVVGSALTCFFFTRSRKKLRASIEA